MSTEQKKSPKKTPKKTEAAAAPLTVGEAQQKQDFSISPEKIAPTLESSEWPLLLKNYDKLLVRTGHYTPINSGCSPLKRPISEYLKYPLLSFIFFFFFSFSKTKTKTNTIIK